MNAPAAATCPTCGGSGVRVKRWVNLWYSDREREKPQRCLACRGKGQVDPARVCPACGQWADQCTCVKHRIIKMGGNMGESMGVHWNSKHKRWVATITRDGKTHYLGEYKQQAMAISIRLKAEDIPVSQLEALKAEYRLLRETSENSNGHGASEPSEDVVEAEVAALDADSLHQKLVAARKADERFQAIREQYCAAERDAVEAWNEYARELAAIGQGDAFARSYLGFLREEITRP